MKYNKAVRDKIPEIIEKSGRKCTVKKLSDVEFLAELEKKLVEELKEYQESKDVEELADVIEVIYRISELKGIGTEKLKKIQAKKTKDKGSFATNQFLIDAKEN